MLMSFAVDFELGIEAVGELLRLCSSAALEMIWDWVTARLVLLMELL